MTQVKKTYEATNSLPFQVEPGVDHRWIGVGYGTFEAAISAEREAWLVKCGFLRIVETKATAKGPEPKAAAAAGE